MAEIIISIEANIVWLVAQDPLCKYWVGDCPHLGIAAEGVTHRELVEAIEEAQQALFVDLMKSGELEAFLKEHKWKMQRPLPQRAMRVRFDIPYGIKHTAAHNLKAMCC